MVSWEFEKPSEWSLGQKIGILGVIFLLIGPFLPYIILDSGLGFIERIPYFNYEWNRLWMFLPFMSAFLVVILLYMKFEINYEKEGDRVNIKPLIVMLWGFWLFLTYLVDAYRLGERAGYGLFIIILGYFLCVIAGFFEWRYSSIVGPQIILGRNKEKEEINAVIVKNSPERNPLIRGREAFPEAMAKEKVSNPNPNPNPNPFNPNTETNEREAVNREPSNNEEKTLIRWSRDISKDGRIYERCLKCGNYVFLTAEDRGESIVFNCPGCGASFNLRR